MLRKIKWFKTVNFFHFMDIIIRSSGEIKNLNTSRITLKKENLYMKNVANNYYINDHGVSVVMFINENGVKEYHLSYEVDDDVTFNYVTTTMTEEEIENIELGDLIDLEDEMEEEEELEIED